MEVKTLLRELARVVGKNIDNNEDLDGEFQISIFYVVFVRDYDLNVNSYGDSYAKKHC